MEKAQGGWWAARMTTDMPDQAGKEHWGAVGRYVRHECRHLPSRRARRQRQSCPPSHRGTIVPAPHTRPIPLIGSYQEKSKNIPNKRKLRVSMDVLGVGFPLPAHHRPRPLYQRERIPASVQHPPQRDRGAVERRQRRPLNHRRHVGDCGQCPKRGRRLPRRAAAPRGRGGHVHGHTGRVGDLGGDAAADAPPPRGAGVEEEAAPEVAPQRQRRHRRVRSRRRGAGGGRLDRPNGGRGGHDVSGDGGGGAGGRFRLGEGGPRRHGGDPQEAPCDDAQHLRGGGHRHCACGHGEGQHDAERQRQRNAVRRPLRGPWEEEEQGVDGAFRVAVDHRPVNSVKL